MSKEGDSDSDVDIVLEEVSKIFRCTDCQRCFLSHAKYVEHFPVYHLQKIRAVTGKSSKEKNVSPAPVTRKVIEVLPGPRGPKCFKEKMAARGASYVLSKKKISLKGSTSGSSSTPLETNSVTEEQHNGHRGGDHEKQLPARCTDIKNTNEVNVSEVGNIEKGIAGNLSTSIENKQTDLKSNDVNQHHKKRTVHPENAVSSKIADSQPCLNNVEVVTLSDSDEGHGEPNTKTGEIDEVRVTHEVPCDQKESSPDLTNRVEIDNNKINGNSDMVIPTGAEKEASQSHAEEIVKKFICQYCNKLFSRERTLLSHINGMHRSELETEQHYNRLCTQDSPAKNNESSPKTTKHNNGTCNKFENAVTKSRDVKRSEKTGSRLSRKRKKSIAAVESKESSIKSPDRREGAPFLAFSCKWCPERFVNLDSLKKHAINVHIKYKFM